jgi:DNA mismatch repair protein MutL
MGRGVIQLMPDDLADQIAAGEVVERPASAVKELVENSIDAGATRIVIELEDGGLTLIRVTDDGAGMTPEDARLCVRRHATSKVKVRADLDAIMTLGFRGEALPSVASVSRFSLLTKPHGALGGTRVRVEGGTLEEVVSAGAPPGTEISVRSLFFNTPARLKFLKTRATETRHVVETVQRIAMANARVGFRLEHNGRQVLDLPPVESLSDRIFGLFGQNESEGLFPLDPAEQDGVICEGFFGKPTLSRRTTSGIWTFVNGRFVRDKTVHGAVRVAYQGMVDKGRHPMVVLFLTVPPTSVDVNVHPAKTEVRFHQSDAVFRAVRRAIANSLAAAPWVPDGESHPQPWRPERGAHASAWTGHAAPHSDDQARLPVRSYALYSSDGEGAEQSARLAARPENPAGYFESLHYIGHFRGTYLLASDGKGLVVVDQHAAHERITYEHLRISWRERRYETQPLLVPHILSLNSLRAATLRDNLELFERLGFEIEPFGDNDFAIKVGPAVLKTARHEALIVDTLDELGESGQSGRIDEAIDSVLIRMACHQSIRAGDTLTIEEVYQLYRDLDRVDFGANCPHGRPVYFSMSLEELETRFGRR